MTGVFMPPPCNQVFELKLFLLCSASAWASQAWCCSPVYSGHMCMCGSARFGASSFHITGGQDPSLTRRQQEARTQASVTRRGQDPSLTLNNRYWASAWASQAPFAAAWLIPGLCVCVNAWTWRSVCAGGTGLFWILVPTKLFQDRGRVV